MRSINKVSEHFPLWRGVGGGFSSTESIIKKSNFHLKPTSEVRNQKSEIRILEFTEQPHSTLLPTITHYLLPIIHAKVRSQKLVRQSLSGGGLEVRMTDSPVALHSTSYIYSTYYPLPITHYPLPITHYSLPITHE